MLVNIDKEHPIGLYEGSDTPRLLVDFIVSIDNTDIFPMTLADFIGTNIGSVSKESDCVRLVCVINDKASVDSSLIDITNTLIVKKAFDKVTDGYYQGSLSLSSIWLDDQYNIMVSPRKTSILASPYYDAGCIINDCYLACLQNKDYGIDEMRRLIKFLDTFEHQLSKHLDIRTVYAVAILKAHVNFRQNAFTSKLVKALYNKWSKL